MTKGDRNRSSQVWRIRAKWGSERGGGGGVLKWDLTLKPIYYSIPCPDHLTSIRPHKTIIFVLIFENKDFYCLHGNIVKMDYVGNNCYL